MPITSMTCFVVTCDVCKEQLAHDEGFPHYESVDALRYAVKNWFPEWTLCADGFAICDLRNTEHTAAIDELVPLKPVPACDGQDEIPFTENGATTP